MNCTLFSAWKCEKWFPDFKQIAEVDLSLTFLFLSPLYQWTSLSSLFLSLYLVLSPSPSPSHGCWLSCSSQCQRFWATGAALGKMAACVEVCSRCRGEGCQMWAVLLVPPWCQTYCWTLERRKGVWGWDNHGIHCKLIGHKTFLRTHAMKKTQQQKLSLSLSLEVLSLKLFKRVWG